MTGELTSDPVTVLFIGGMGRSGTTIFELSLATDGRAVSLGEVTHLWQRSLLDDELCGCGERFSTCQFWQEVGDRAFGGWAQVNPHRVLALKKRLDRTLRTPQLILKIGSRSLLADAHEYASYYSRIYRAARDVSGRPVVIDSSKQASLPYVLRYAHDLRLRVVHCVRDSRAVAYSWTKTVVRPEAQSADSNLMTRYSPGVLALKWLQHNLVIEGLRLQRVPVFNLRYEDWVADPRDAAAKALALAGLPPRSNDQLSDSWVELSVSHTCSGNPMRFKTGCIDIRRDETWRTALPRRSRLLVSAITAPGLAAYGYPRKRS